jgi:hypothetical protein
MHRFCAALIAGGLLALSSPAVADTKPSAAECIDSFENAQRAQKGGHLVFAQKLYAECAVSACPKQVRNDCAQGQSETDRAIATVTVVVRDPAGADVPATLKLDGNPFTPEAGRATPIDPGPRVFQYTVNGEMKSLTVTIAEGEKARLVVLPAGETVAAPVPTPATPPSTSPLLSSSSSTSDIGIVGPIIVGSIGALALIAAFGVYGLSANEADERDKQQAIVNDPTRSKADREAAIGSVNSHNNAADTDQTLALLVGAGGLVFVAGAAAWYFLGRPSKRAAVVPIMTPHYAGTAFSLAF